MTRPNTPSRRKTSREGALRVDQRIGEEPEFFVARAFTKALPYMDQNRALAIIEWMLAKSKDWKTWTRRK